MSELTKQSKNRDRKLNRKVLFGRSIKKSMTENLEMKERISDLKYKIFRVEQVLIERGIKY